MMNCLINPLFELEGYKSVLDSVKKLEGPISLTGPSDSQKAHISFSICEHTRRRGIFITHNEMQARKLFDDFSFFLGDDALFFPAKEIMLYDIEAKNYDTIFHRIRTLDRLLRGDYRIVVASVESVMHRLIPADRFAGCVMELALGERLNPPDFLSGLTYFGYERVDAVEGEGQFAVRGGIMDVFPIGYEDAVRVELFDDEIDSIRRFDTASQRSVDRVENVRVIPAREIIYLPGEKPQVIKRIREELGRYAGKIEKSGNEEALKHISEKIESDIERIENDYYFPGIDRYIPYIAGSASALWNYARDAIVFVDEPAKCVQRAENVQQEHYEVCRNLLEKGMLLPGCVEIMFDSGSIAGRFENNDAVYLSTLSAESFAARCRKSLSIASRLIGSYQGHVELLVEDIKGWKERKSKVVVLSGTKNRGERLVESLLSNGVESVYREDCGQDLLPGQVVVTRGSLNRGFEYPAIGMTVISGSELFGQGKRRKRRHEGQKGAKINLFTDLSPGDYVVHQSHGIGQYVGIEKLTIDGTKRDYLKIRYQAGDFLYIPTNQLDLIQKYIGAEGKAPKLNKLGGTDWLKTKNRVRESLKQLAGQLIELYAKRQSAVGHAFSKDTVWQKQLEDLFPYEETEDQLVCIEEVKRDMESPRPMERLLCGDVGYGKTEVALRAVFKAVMDGKQVAYLVPTTILAQQHFKSFIERMRDFPVSVDVLSRFRTQSEQKKVLRGVKSGAVDVLIGTHRLLQKDIRFRDLGLLVIDEEHRFGVAHKEKLKNFKPNVDVLTLTATPIPRTLHMSLTGIRDISVIEDPPEERYPIQTYVMEYNPDLVRDAIIRELGRRGQVFYLYNRVRSIQKKAYDIQSLVPDAKIAIAHGQMDERSLEDTMYGFINGEYDILVCTTIIESGLDMPNVNTIIIEDADRMGLAQLHQIRGRVGRSNRLAYAYITYRKDKVLHETAEKRLQAIKEFTELGSGFKIAMRDLEIRGAGNLLGPEQHGHLEAVGYDMYCRLLDEAVREAKGETAVRKDEETTIDINISAFIDDEYVGSESRKIEMYKKIASIRDRQDVLDIEDELTDRYGDMPPPVRNLISIAYIKALASDAGFSSVTEKNGSVILQVKEGSSMDLDALGRLSAKYRRQILFNAGASPYLIYKAPETNRERLLDNIKILLQDVKDFTSQKTIKYN